MTALSRSYGPVFGMLGGWASDRLGPKRTMVVSLIVTGALTLLLGFVADSWISAVVIIQPALAVWFFPAGFAALAVIAPPQARNLAVGFTIPFGYLIGGGAIPTFIGMMGDAGLFALGFTITGLIDHWRRRSRDVAQAAARDQRSDRTSFRLSAAHRLFYKPSYEAGRVRCEDSRER